MLYIVLLRGINVSGKHKIIMKEFVDILLKNSKLFSIKSYIQSGNFVVKGNIHHPQEVSDLFSKIILKEYQYKIKAFVYTLDEFKKIFTDYPFPPKDKVDYVTFLSKAPEQEQVNNINKGLDTLMLKNNIIYIQYATKYSDSKLNNNYFEKQLDISATTRNIRTISKLIEIAEK
ncbi:DUF1697 domain-containing protein [Wenyingzhuangia marina]|uniref:Uncharacterized conserved protein, DUF1697 family n=1 Tax=Wenyingzhuangia marina TaxID=1195760 RepID=A0A1M5W3E6_9FLAO|nr:DUF1697 domain-containing protein [Wenyingzhuangia marina]GGF76365.1 hypothetical protein GCM10011397_19120 [Wenyingzhuangia marina]SHH81724.1 Uncharacterized conserved protein, DUF1697 family [Wenyingzhuangia marina]